MKTNGKKKLRLEAETVRNITIRSGVRTGDAGNSLCVLSHVFPTSALCPSKGCPPHPK